MNIMEFISHIPLFQGLSTAERRRIAESDKTFIRFDMDEFIIREGSNSTGFFVLISGAVRVTRNDLPNKVIALLKPGTIFGEMAYLTNQRRSTNVVANDDGVVVMRLDNQVMGQMSADLRDKIKDRLIELLVKRLNQMNDALIRRAILMQEETGKPAPITQTNHLADFVEEK